ncbi:MAG: DUF6531 domain-containing protein [Myxococcota bacterium]
MSIASKWLDIVVGLDLHMEMVPTPAPVPVPFPHPFTGLIFDPMGLIMDELVAAVTAWATDTPPDPGKVWIAGMPATVTGDEVSMPVPHIFIPPGISWAPVPRAPKPTVGLKGKLPMPDPPLPPPSDALLLMGSMTVKMMGANAVRMGEMALSCSDPVRMPTSTVVSTGLPKMVIVGGPPGIDWQQVVMMAGMRALRSKWAAGKLHGAVDKVIPEKFKRARNIAHKSACFLTGHPVNVATGSVLTDGVDFELPGPLPVRFERNYNSNWFDRESPLGYGWAHSLDQKIWLEPQCVAYQTADGREVEFNTRALQGGVMRKGDVLEDPVNRLTLRAHGNFAFTLEDAAGVVTEFAPIAGEDPINTDRGLARIVRQRTPAGQVVEYRYDERARLAEVHDAGGRVVKFEHDVRGRLTRIWLPAAGGEGHRQHAEYRYDESGDLAEVRDAAGKPMQFGYDRHLLVRERDRNGLTFYFKYDGYGRFARCVETWGIDPAGDAEQGIYHHLIDYNRKGRTATVTNSLGEVTVYSYDGAFMVTSVIDPAGGTTTYEYDHAHRETVVVDPLGQRTETTYDARGNVVMVVAPSGEAGKRVSKIRYDDKNRPVSVVDPEGAEWTWRYDAMGRVLARVDPLGHATHYRYEGAQLQQVLDAAGKPTVLAYDSAGGLARATAPDGTVTQWRRDALGRVIERTDPNGNVQRRTYDALGRIARVQEPDGNVRDLAYDAMGNVLRARDRVRDITFTYCQMGKVASRTHTRAAGSTATVRYRWDTEGQLVGVINERGLEHRYELDVLGEVSAEFGWDGNATLYQRDPVGRVVSVLREATNGEPPRSRTLAYDDAGNLVSVEHGDGSSIRYAYRKDGALIEAEADGVCVSFERDALGQIIKESVTGIDPDADDWVASSYDHAGLRIALQSSRGAATDFVRNPMGDVTSVAYRDGAHQWSVAFSRDRFGQEVDRTVGSGEAAVRGYWWRDALGRPTQHWVGQANAPEGVQPTSHRLRKYGWDSGDLLRSLEDDALGSIAFEHDVRGFLHKAEITPAGGDAPSVELRNPDEVGNLFRSLDRSEREYGEAGQILKRSLPASEGGGVITYRYDADGNLAEREDPDGGRWWYHWNDAGQLVHVDTPRCTAVSFRYDAFGRRVEKNANGVITRWVWDGNVPLHEWRTSGDAPQLRRTPELVVRRNGLLAARDPADDEPWRAMLAERAADDEDPFAWLAAECLRLADQPPEPSPPDEDGLLTWLFEPESFAPLARVSEQRGAMAVFTDHLGTPLCLTDDAGALAWQATTDTYGHCTVTAGDPALCPWRFPGQYQDPETGLFYNRFRYYDPHVGGYVSRDPIGLAGGLAVHGYVDDPLSWVDPFGLAKKKGGCGSEATAAGEGGQYVPDRTLPTDDLGVPVPDSPYPHSQLGKSKPKYGSEPQAREWDYGSNGNLQPHRDIDFTDHGYPNQHAIPHQHKLTPNNPKIAPKGGFKRGKGLPL